MATLALKALSIGAEKIPDKAFHAIPGGYFRPPDADNSQQSRSSSRKKKDRSGMHDNGEGSDSRVDRSDRRNRHRHRRKSDDYSASESGSDTEDDTRRRKPRRPTRRNRRYTSSQNLERGYDSDGLTRDQYQQSRGMQPPSQPGSGGQYFPPPPMHAYEDNTNYRQEPNTQFPSSGADGAFDRQQPFHPQGGAYYPQQASPAPQPRQPQPEFGTPRPGSAASSDRYHPTPAYSPPTQTWEPKCNSRNPGYTPHAGYAENYTTGYQPSQPYYPPQAEPNQGALAVQPPAQQPDTGYSTALAPYNMPPPQSDPAMNGSYPTYIPPRDNWRPSRSPPRGRCHHNRSKSRGGRSSRDDDRSRSRSRSRSRDHSRDRHRGRDSDRHSKSRNRSRSMAAQAKEALQSNRDVASSALGVVAGGLIGNQVGRGNKFGTLAGAVLGGFGANMWEKRHADKKEAREKRYHRDNEVVREAWDERRRLQQQQQYDREQQHNHTATRRSRSDREEHSTQSLRGVYKPNLSYRDRSRHPYARSNPSITMPTPKPSSPHVHFAKLDPKEFIKSATSKASAEDLNSRSGHAATRAMKDASTQTSPWIGDHYKKSYKQKKKDFVKKTIEKEMPSTDKVYQAARSIRKATRKGTWDGSVVEEVFMEMTGVPIGDKEKMKSNWKN